MLNLQKIGIRGIELRVMVVRLLAERLLTIDVLVSALWDRLRSGNFGQL